jgi:hypothetical protein
MNDAKSFNNWLTEQKQRIVNICLGHGRTARRRDIHYRSGPQDRGGVPTGPANLVPAPNDRDQSRVNVMLWVQGDAQPLICALRMIFAFPDAVIPRLGLRDRFDDGTPYGFSTNWLPDLAEYLNNHEGGQYHYASIEDFDTRFPW